MYCQEKNVQTVEWVKRMDKKIEEDVDEEKWEK